MNKVLSILLLLLIYINGFSQTSKSDSLLGVLKFELTRENAYNLDKEKRINLLRFELLQTDSADFDAQFDLYSRIFEEYRSFKFDSAFAYVRRIIRLCTKFGKEDRLVRSKLLLGTTLLNSGFFKEAFDVTGEIDTAILSQALKTEYLILHARLNAGIAEYDNDAYFSPSYRNQSEADFKKAEIVTPSNDFEQTINQAFLPDSVRHQKLTADYFYDYIIRRRLPEHTVAMVATRISFAYTGRDRVRFLALAAINDIRSSTKETLAIFLLGQELFKMDNINDAYICMQEAARNAKFYGARNRAVQIESILPLVASKLIDQKQHEKDKLLIGLLLFLIVAVVLFFLLVIYRRQILRIKANERVIKEKNSELETVNGKLWESSKIKEELIGLFFKTCSSYIDTLDKIKHQTLHNIKLGKYKDVGQFLNNVHIDEEKGNLYNMLDSVFLTMFPNFIASFNTLLKKEDQIWPKSGETLNATLRIFALMRLGISEHEAIAKILDYSVSTVYTYKTRIKSRALVPANDFEQKIMEIKFIDSNQY
ncbi:hypothetical protein F0L74_12845 [Chitinophaga agrisoli]|uniref:DUF6377 domain-containing protein n=1 Tax=Chitinophaga agrisoli TaxID=2607653 RepID=A0A5B2VUA5_9BACT|nr:DUF6377 domain-containing protein [Chitinophaga agrisoli]KAA2243383.1 hypothetical protein F0L74_12845 [Chitinophaga agrisoli]